MSPSKSQKNAARLILGLLTIFGLVVMAMPGISLGQVPVVQQTTSSPSSSPSGSSSSSPSQSASGSPSASGTATPAPTGPAIQFLNPSSHSLVVSTKSDGTNTTYHLVAAARSVPSNPLVEFKYQEGDSNEVTIGIASRVGTTDTFELNWAAGGLDDGTYTLKAILYNGAVELSRDEEEVTINNSDDIDDPQAETVEILSPTNGSSAGFFDPLGEPLNHTVIDVTSSDDAGLPSGSSGTDAVTVYYTKTPIGTEPEWIECGSGAGEDEGETTSIRCTLEEGDTPLSVTALAAVANPVLPLIGGSGDAHRVFPYAQVPTTITAVPLNQSGKPANACADPIVATVLDQNNKKIAGINTDVHAKGPNDGTLFDTANNSENQPPDKAHSSPEAGWDCDAGEEAGEQGQHEYPPGNPDTKHIESIDGTSDEAGQFTFQLYATAGGTTDYAVFADTDDDDQWCAAEESVEGSVSWTATASPSPSASASSSPSSSPSSSSSGSPSAQPTTTADPGPTELGPDIQSCPTPTSSPTSTAGPGNRSISLVASKSKVAQRRPVTLSGQVQSETANCENNEVVEIQRRIHGSSTFKEFKTTATDDSGNYTVTTKPARGADYQAIAPEQGSCDEATSSTASVQVRPKVTITPSKFSPDRGERVRIVGKVTPNHKKDKVLLQRRKGGKWVKVARDTLSARSRYRFIQTVSWDSRKFRVVFPKQDADHIRGKSKAITLRAT